MFFFVSLRHEETITSVNWHILGTSAEGTDECHGHGAQKCSVHGPSMTCTYSMFMEGDGFQVGEGTWKRYGHVEVQAIIKKWLGPGRSVN